MFEDVYCFLVITAFLAYDQEQKMDYFGTILSNAYDEKELHYNTDWLKLAAEIFALTCSRLERRHSF